MINKEYLWITLVHFQLMNKRILIRQIIDLPF